MQRRSPPPSSREIRRVRNRPARADRSAAGRGVGADRRQRHVPDRPARPRRLLQHALSGGLRPRGRGIVQAVGTSVTKFAPGDHVVISFPWCGACPNCRRDMQSHCMQELRPEDARHARRRLDAHEQGRRAGLQRVLPAILLRDPRHRQRALHGEGQERRAARTPGTLRLQRADRGRRSAQLHAAAGRAMPSPCSASARSGCRA